MSAFYLDILKDRLYVSGTDSKLRRSAQSALFEITEGLLKLMSPILSFTASEAWDALHARDQNAPLDGSIFFSDFPEPNDANLLDDEAEQRWKKLVRVRSEITRALEKARAEKIIGHPLEAHLLLAPTGELADFIEANQQMLKEISIVSELEVVDHDQFGDLMPLQSEEIEGLFIGVKAASGEKCERCWTRSATVGAAEAHPSICGRCLEVVQTLDLQV